MKSEWEVRDLKLKIDNLKNKKEKLKLIYQWVKVDHINFQEFDILVDYYFNTI